MGSVFTNEQRTAIKAGAPHRMQMVCALHQAGARLMPGSDCPACGTIPGRSLLHELELFEQSGIPAAAVLHCATTAPAEFLGRQHEVGTVTTGKRADLLLLNADPSAGIKALRQQAGVMVGGTWLSTATLSAQVAAFNASPVPA
jgi:imidazolonepropionase-like amidohydrolase